MNVNLASEPTEFFTSFAPFDFFFVYFFLFQEPSSLVGSAVLFFHFCKAFVGWASNRLEQGPWFLPRFPALFFTTGAFSDLCFNPICFVSGCSALLVFRISVPFLSYICIETISYDLEK